MSARGEALSTEQTLAFVAPLLRNGQKVLEVGCGAGELAQHLARKVFLTAIDPSAKAVRAARRRGVRAQQVDLLSFEGGPFDAVVFARSLHHIHPLKAAVAHARGLLKPGGRLIVDDAQLEVVDRPTAAWFFERVALLQGAKLLAPHGRHARADHDHVHGEHGGHEHGAHEHEHEHGEHEHEHGDHEHEHGDHEHAAPRRPVDLLARWREHHAHVPALHLGRQLRSEIERQFGKARVAVAPYLFRYFDWWLRGAAADALAVELLQQERRALAAGEIQPVGLRLVATLRAQSRRGRASGTHRGSRG